MPKSYGASLCHKTVMRWCKKNKKNNKILYFFNHTLCSARACEMCLDKGKCLLVKESEGTFVTSMNVVVLLY